MFEVYEPYLPVAIRQFDAVLRANPDAMSLGAFFLLSFVNVLRCCGRTLPSEADGLEERWLAATLSLRPRMLPDERLTAAFACVGSTQLPLMPRFLRKPVPKRCQPRLTFGPDTTGFVRYLAAAVATAAPETAVAPGVGGLPGYLPGVGRRTPATPALDQSAVGRQCGVRAPGGTPRGLRRGRSARPRPHSQLERSRR